MTTRALTARRSYKQQLVEYAMSILRFLKPDSTHDGLPNPQGSLSDKLSTTAIASANDLVREAQKPNGRKNRRTYHKLTPSMRANIGKYACENGPAAAARHFSRRGRLDKPLNESTARGLKKAYLVEVGRKKRAREDDLSVEKLEPGKRGRPLLLGEQMDEKVKQYLLSVRACGGMVNSAIAIAGAKEIILTFDKTRLSEYGGYLNLTRAWAKSLLKRMGFVK